MNRKRKIIIGAGVLLLILIMTNPSSENFKEFIGHKGIRRSSNFLVFSIYQDEYTHKSYYGIIKNFIEIEPSTAEVKAANEKAKEDSNYNNFGAEIAAHEAAIQDSLAKVKAAEEEWEGGREARKQDSLAKVKAAYEDSLKKYGFKVLKNEKNR